MDSIKHNGALILREQERSGAALLCLNFKRISPYFSLNNLWERMKNKLDQISTVVLWTHRHVHTHTVHCTNTAVPAVLWVGGLGWGRGRWCCDLHSATISEISLTIINYYVQIIFTSETGVWFCSPTQATSSVIILILETRLLE